MVSVVDTTTQGMEQRLGLHPIDSTPPIPWHCQDRLGMRALPQQLLAASYNLMHAFWLAGFVCRGISRVDVAL